MVVSATTANLLATLFSTPDNLKLFRQIAHQRIVEKSALNGHTDQLGVLQDADLIEANPGGTRFFVTAKGLQVERDLEKIPFTAGQR